jgi:hypothetical protein
MSHNLNDAVAVVGIDIGKNSFHVVGLDSRGAIVLRPCAIFLPMAALEFEPSSNRLQEIGE